MGTSGHRRVVITGLGAVTPLGNDVRSSWENLVAGRATAGPITAFDTTGFAVTFACEAKDFEPTQWIERKQARRMDRFAQMIVAAAHQAQADAGLEVEPECDRVGVSVATAMGGLKSFEDACETLIERGPERVNPFSITAIIPEHRRRPGLDRARHERSALIPVHRLRRLDDGDRRRPRRDPPRSRRRHARRWQRGADHACRDRRLQRHARALASKRRPRAREPAVRGRSRRLRHGRGRRRARARGTRARDAGAGRGSTPSSSVTASPPTRST